jgi:uncharacterized C2H2 Zn-finger protein
MATEIKEQGVIVHWDRWFGQILECPKCHFVSSTWRWLTKDDDGKEVIQCPNCETEY